jgi:hypothetical protein
MLAWTAFPILRVAVAVAYALKIGKNLPSTLTSRWKRAGHLEHGIGTARDRRCGRRALSSKIGAVKTQSNTPLLDSAGALVSP